MRVFELEPDYSRYQGLEPVREGEDDEAYGLLWNNDFTPIATIWKPFWVKVPSSDRDAMPTDFTTVLASSSMRVFSRRAAEALDPLLKGDGELLPLLSHDGDFFLFHPLQILDAVDLSRCQWDRGSIVRYEFLPERIANVTVFRRLELLDDGRRIPSGPDFVTDRFVQRVEEAGLAGFKFELLWPPEAVEAAKLAEAERKRARRKKPAAPKTRKPVALTPAESGAIPWKPGEKPEPFPFLRHIWVTAINQRMDGDWIDGVLAAVDRTPDDGLLGLCADSLQRILQSGADREDLCFLARSFVTEGVWWAFKMLDYPGVTTRDFAALADKLMESAPRGRDGRPGGWPVRARRRGATSDGAGGDAKLDSPLVPKAFLRQIWQDAINDRMSGQWIEDVIQAADASPDQALTVTCADALQRLLDNGVDRTDLSHLARHQVAEGIRAGFRLLSDPGVQDDDFDELANELLTAGPRGSDGLAGGWPLNKTQNRT